MKSQAEKLIFSFHLNNLSKVSKQLSYFLVGNMGLLLHASAVHIFVVFLEISEILETLFDLFEIFRSLKFKIVEIFMISEILEDPEFFLIREIFMVEIFGIFEIFEMFHF